MNYTQYYNLQKDLTIEKYDVNVVNMNSDIIDSALHRLDLKNQSQDNLLATKDSLNSEISRATSAEDELSENIANEVNRAIMAENVINANLTDHDSSPHSHSDIRSLVSDLTTRLNALADSDDTTLDQLSEIVAYIKNNKDLIDGITTSKVNVSDIVDDLISTATNKPLSAKQGKILKDLIINLTTVVGNKVDKISGKDLSTNDYTTIEKNKLNGIASGAEVNVQSDWNVTDTESDAFIKNKPTIPVKTSQLTNDSNYAKTTDNVFIGNRGEIPLADIDKFVSRKSGGYKVVRSGDSDQLTVLAQLTGSSSAIEFYHHYDMSLLKVRSTIDNNRYSAWKEIAFKDSSIASANIANFLNPHNITADTNLNSLTTPGFYYCPANVTVATLSNSPTTNSFFMIAGKHAGIYQEITEYMTNNPKKYIRNYYNNTWGSWYRVYTTADPPGSMGITYQDTEPGGLKVNATWIGI